MGQRLSDSAVTPVRHALSDPYWKTPLGFKKNGQPFYPVGGASPDDSEGGEGGTGGSGDGGGGGGSEGQQGGEGGSGEGSGGSDDGAKGKDSDKIDKAEYEKVLERMKAADRNAAAALAKLKELEEKDLSEQEKVLKKVPELEAKVSELSEENKGLQAKVAFLESNSHTWHDPEAALKLADLSEVYGEDGSIDKTALKKAMDDLAKKKPYLVKSSNDDGKGGKGGSGGAGGGQASGAAAGSGQRGGQGQTTDDAALRKKYPALNV